MSDFILEPGMKVECIRDYREITKSLYLHQLPSIAFPTVGTIYTVRAVEKIDGHLGIVLDEIINPITEFEGGEIDEPYWDARHFRPIRSRDTDITIFRELDRKAGEFVKRHRKVSA